MARQAVYTLMLATAMATLAPSGWGREVATQAYANQTEAQRTEHMAWWRQAKYGMFIHWGLYSIPARGEWVMIDEHIPVSDYAELASQFNPVKFNAKEWVQVAKDAGMKYMVITAKHHDGFAMYDSKVSPYNVVQATPWGRDPLKELSEECKKADIKFGIYYSQAFDWYHPGGKIPRGGAWDDAQKGNFEHYFRTISIPQVQEIIEEYDPAVIWFDMPSGMTDEYCREMMDKVRALKPSVIVNSRLRFGGAWTSKLKPYQQSLLRELGVDYLTYRDREIPETTAWRDWETCMTLNESWGFTANDHEWKDAKTIIEMLVRVVNMDGNFLLNFGPTAEGVLPAEAVASVREAGAWLRVNGEAVYGVRASDLKKVKEFPAVGDGKRSIRPEPDVSWLATERPASGDQPAKTYLSIFKWPGSRLEVNGVTGTIEKVYLLSDPDGTPLSFRQDGDHCSVELPETAPDSIATVVCLERDDQ